MSIALGFGFTVDDALISARVAHHLRTVGSHSFNPGEPAVDCVTPLGWSFVLAPWSGSGAWNGLLAARILGALSAGASAWVLGQLIGDAGATSSPTGAPRKSSSYPQLCVLLAALATHLPFGAWATSGMETSCVMLLCTVGTLGIVRRRLLGPLCVGLAAAWRPELVPWAAAFVLFAPAPSPPAQLARGAALTSEPPGAPSSRGVRRRLLPLGLVLLPVMGVIAIRLLWFGFPFPLAVLAKPSDAAHGWSYAGGGLRFMAFPILAVGWGAWRGTPGVVRAGALALAAHFAAVVGVGGDWMSLFRLFVPVTPAGFWVASHVLRQQRPWVVGTKGAVVVALNLTLVNQLVESVRHVLPARAALVEQFTPLLGQSRHVAALDVGWVGAATPARITDLAGVTDPEIARLPGGHTSKRLPSNLLERRAVDALVVLLAAGEPPPDEGTRLDDLRAARGVERDLVRQSDAPSFRTVTSVELSGTTQRYVLLTRHPEQ